MRIFLRKIEKQGVREGKSRFSHAASATENGIFAFDHLYWPHVKINSANKKNKHQKSPKP